MGVSTPPPPQKKDKPKQLPPLKPDAGNLPNSTKRLTLNVLLSTEEWLQSRRLQQVYANRTQDPHCSGRRKISSHRKTFIALKITITSVKEQHILCSTDNKKLCCRIKGLVNLLVSGNTNRHVNKTYSKQRRSYRWREHQPRLSEAV